MKWEDIEKEVATMTDEQLRQFACIGLFYSVKLLSRAFAGITERKK